MVEARSVNVNNTFSPDWEVLRRSRCVQIFFKQSISGVVGLLGCKEPVSHLILQPKLLNCVRSHVDLYCFEEPSCEQ